MRKVYLLFTTLKLFSENERMEHYGFQRSMMKSFKYKRLKKGVATRATEIYTTDYEQTTYNNVVQHKTHDRARLPLTWPLIAHPLLSRFITEDLLRD